MALLLNIDYSFDNILNAHLTFDDKSEKYVTFEKGSIYTITYNRIGTLSTVTGILDKIVIQQNSVRVNYGVPQNKFILELDCSNEFYSNIVRISVDDIRDVYVNIDKADQNGNKLLLDEYYLHNELITKTHVDYEDIKSVFTIVSSINSYSMNYTELYHLLTTDRLFKDTDSVVHPWVYYNLTLDCSENLDLGKANQYRISLFDNNITIYKDLIYKLNGTRINIPIFGFKVYYRTSENSKWNLIDYFRDASNLYEVLANALQTSDMQYIVSNYGKLYRFEPLLNGTNLSLIVAFEDYDDIRDDAIVTDREEFIINYVNEITPTGVGIGINHLTLKVGFTYQIETYIIPWNAPVQTIKYLSANNEIATVDENGLVTAISAGETEISFYPIDNPSLINSYKLTVEN